MPNNSHLLKTIAVGVTGAVDTVIPLPTSLETVAATGLAPKGKKVKAGIESTLAGHIGASPGYVLLALKSQKELRQ